LSVSRFTPNTRDVVLRKGVVKTDISWMFAEYVVAAGCFHFAYVSSLSGSFLRLPVCIDRLIPSSSMAVAERPFLFFEFLNIFPQNPVIELFDSPRRTMRTISPFPPSFLKGSAAVSSPADPSGFSFSGNGVDPPVTNRCLVFGRLDSPSLRMHPSKKISLFHPLLWLYFLQRPGAIRPYTHLD